MIVALEFVERFMLVGPYHVGYILFGVDISDLGATIVLQHEIADGLNQVGFSQTHAAIDKKRVVGNAGTFSNLNGACPG